MKDIFVDKVNSFQRFFLILLIITPVIDILNGIQEYVIRSSTPLSVGQIVRLIIFLLIVFYYIKMKPINIVFLSTLIFIFLAQQLILANLKGINIVQETLFISKIYYNILLALIINSCASLINRDKLIGGIIKGAMIVALTLIITRVFNIGVGAYGEVGHKGLFMGLNDITAVLMSALPFVLYKILHGGRKRYVIYYLSILMSLILLGTKTGVIGSVVITLYYLLVSREFNRVLLKKIALWGVCIIGAMIFFVFFYKEYSETILLRYKYFYYQLDPVSFLLSSRNMTLIWAFSNWISNLLYIVFGTGFTQGSIIIGQYLIGHGMIEMDLFDIGYFYGIFAFIGVVWLFFPSFLQGVKSLIVNKDSEYATVSLAYIITFIISVTGGHVLLSPLAGVYFIAIFGLQKSYRVRISNEE